MTILFDLTKNEFEFEGKTYVAIENNSCEGCVFDKENRCTKPAQTKVLCSEFGRLDDRNVIWIEQ